MGDPSAPEQDGVGRNEQPDKTRGELCGCEQLVAHVWRQASDGGRAPDPQEVEQWHAQFAHPELLCVGELQVVRAVAQGDRFFTWHPAGVEHVKGFRARALLQARALLVEVPAARPPLRLFRCQLLITDVPAHDTLPHVPPPFQRQNTQVAREDHCERHHCEAR